MMVMANTIRATSDSQPCNVDISSGQEKQTIQQQVYVSSDEQVVNVMISKEMFDLFNRKTFKT